MPDFRRAIQRLARTPGFAFVAVATLALGVGGNTAIFSVVNAALIRPLPYPAADAIVRIHSPGLHGPNVVSPPDFVDWRQGTRSFSGMAAVNVSSSAVTGAGLTEEVDGAVVTSDFFTIMGIRPALGRGIDSTDAQTTGSQSVVLSDSLWRRLFRADPGIVGRSIRLDDVPSIVIGVMPRGFSYPAGAQYWMPLAFTQEQLTTQRGAHYLDVVARLRPGVSLARARSDMATIWSRLASEYPTKDYVHGGDVVTLRASLTGDARPALLLLLAAVGLVLLIACANVANLLLVRAMRRAREITVRAALGATRGRLIVESMTEAMVLAGTGGAVGLVLAIIATKLMAALRPDDAILATSVLDWRVLVAAVVLSLATGLVFGLTFAHQAVPREHIAQQLAGAGRSSSASAANRRTKRTLAIAEVALAVILVSCAGLLIRSFVALRAIDPGFRDDNRVVFDVALPDVQYDTPEKRALFFSEFLTRVRAIPGVREAAATTGIPMGPFSSGYSAHSLDGRILSPAEQDRFSTQARRVSDDYFAAMGIPIRAGRAVTTDDRAGRQPVVIVNEAAARLLFPGANAIGHSLEIGTHFEPGLPKAGGEIVGIVGNVREFGLAREPVPEIYFATDQFPPDYGELVVHTTLEPAAVLSAARQVLRAMAPDVAAFHLTSMAALEAASIGRPRFVMMLLGLFAAVAITMAVIGLYGVIAFGVGERTKEIGIRMALGAQREEVARLVLSDAMMMGGAGIAAGLTISLAAVQSLQSLLYGVRPLDPEIFAATGALMLAATLLATWLPARRATRFDPVTAIRAD